MLVTMSLLVLLVAGASAAPRTAPDSFLLEMKTTVPIRGGKILFNITRAYSPHGVDRLYELLMLQGPNYYDNTAFFRVVPGFVAQFGISGETGQAQKWENAYILDDPVVISNLKGTLAFASAGPNTRTTQLFLNLVDNVNLDQEGFSPLGQIIDGFDVALSINAKYQEQPDQGSIYVRGNSYLKHHFPLLDYITSARVVGEESATPAL